MAPSLEVDEGLDMSAPLKAAPKLVAPEPGLLPRFYRCITMLMELRTLSWSRITASRQS